jgi:hypothetical protein
MYVNPEQKRYSREEDYYSQPLITGEAGLTDDDIESTRRGYHGSGSDLVDSSGNPSNIVRARSERRTPESEEYELANHNISPEYFVNYVAANPKTASRGEPQKAERAAEVEAWEWANSTMHGRPRVYKGEAMDFDNRPVGPDPNLLFSEEEDLRRVISYDRPFSMAAGAFRVSDTMWTPPPLEGRSVQGTLPHINWNQFGLPNVANPEDVVMSNLTSKDQELAKERKQDQLKKLERDLDSEAAAAEKAKKRNAQFGFMG